ncbi:signal peptidase I [Marmoricola sp. RAF53]|uniref:signal peptidase I n=1 Tax=Marmoricola sp. RAF53 TaxID=3233059 RepID=UPI003F9915D2
MTETAAATKKPGLPVWQESLLLLVIAVVLAVVVKSFFLQAFYIPSASMEPQLVKNDRILVEKVSFWGSGTPHRGDVVVFADPGDWLGGEGQATANPLARGLQVVGLYPAGGHLVKRVIGVGGDRVRCCDADGRITVNGKALDESSYLPEGTEPSEKTFDVRVPAGHLWVMGDNRGNSADSRAHLDQPGGGFVPVDLVVGKVWALVWPWKRAQLVHARP